MGATGWVYEVAWQADIEMALTELCAKAFAEGDYQKSWEYGGAEYLDAWAEARAELAEQVGDEYAELFVVGLDLEASIASVRTGGLPTTIDAARELNAEEGMASILDCCEFCVEPRPFTVSELTQAEEVQLFGSVKPSNESVRAGINREMSEGRMLERETGRVAVAFSSDGEPVSLFFFGFSGD